MRWLAPACASALLAMGCSAHSQTAASTPPASAPAADDAAIAARVSDTCDACHEATTYTVKHLTAAQWGEVIDQMVAKGASVSDSDYSLFTAYLAKHYGPEARP